MFDPPKLLERLGRRLELLKGARGGEARQATLRATIDWSYGLLDERERAVLRKLGVFAGGCALEAAEAIAGADVDDLQSLIDKSLLRRRRDTDGEPRFWLLETIREYALDELAVARETDEVEQRHASWYASFGQRVGAAQGQPDEEALIERVGQEVDNLLLALSTAERMSDPAVPAGLLRAHVALSMLGADRELIAAFEALLARADLAAPLRAQALQGLAVSLVSLGRADDAVTALVDSIAIGRSLPISHQRIRAHVVLLSTLINLGRFDEAGRWLPALEELLASARAAGLAVDLEAMYFDLLRAHVALATERWQEAIEACAACLAMPGAASGYGRGVALNLLALAAAHGGDPERVHAAALESLELNGRLGNGDGVSVALLAAALALLDLAPPAAEAMLVMSERLRVENGFTHGLVENRALEALVGRFGPRDVPAGPDELDAAEAARRGAELLESALSPPG
jgi:tetratricopeptide (TPR) repeat protein